MPEPIASWRPDLDCWVASDDETESLFSVPSAVFSETFPTSGMTRSGTAYALPTSEPLTDGSGSSSLPLLGTPTTRDWKDTGSMENVPENGLLGRQVLNRLAPPLLPTPNTHNWKESGHCRDFGADLTHALTCPSCQHRTQGKASLDTDDEAGEWETVDSQEPT